MRTIPGKELLSSEGPPLHPLFEKLTPRLQTVHWCLGIARGWAMISAQPTGLLFPALEQLQGLVALVGGCGGNSSLLLIGLSVCVLPGFPVAGPRGVLPVF